MKRPSLIGAGMFVFLSWNVSGGVGRWTTNWVASGSFDLSVVADPHDPRVLYAGASSVFKSKDAGGSWDLCGDGPSNITALAVDPTSSEVVYAGTSAGTLFRSMDGCEQWSALFERNTGIMTPPPVRWITIDPVDPRIIFLQHASSIRLPGDLLRSDDSGLTWKEVSLQDPISRFVTVLTFDPQDPQVLYAGTEENQGFFRSSDGGGSWTNIRNEISDSHVSSLVVNASTETIYAGVIPMSTLNPSAGVWKSLNGGLSFSFAGAGLPSLGVYDLVIDPRRSGVFYAATQGAGVFVTRDEGQTWATLNLGLESLSVHKLAIDPLGQNLHAATDAGVFDFEFLPDRPPILHPSHRSPPTLVSH